jgi:hypothetical protein
MITPQAALVATAVGVAAVALTLALKGYIDRNRQSNGKVVIPENVIYDVRGGINAAIAGDQLAVIAAAGRIENAGVSDAPPGMYDYVRGGRRHRTKRKRHGRKTRKV